MRSEFGLPGAPGSSRATVIDAEIDTWRPGVELRLEATKDALPLVRQALRGLGESLHADGDALHDAELAVTEACANVAMHAYQGHQGTIEVSLEARACELLAIVRDNGRGMRLTDRGRSVDAGGLGLAVIEGLASQLEIRSERRQGTEVVMTIALGADEPQIDPERGLVAERVVRRLAAMTGAQTDLTPDRIMEALLVVELIVRHAHGRLLGDKMEVRLDRLGHGFELRVGPLERDGAAAVVHDADVPVLGSLIERLADRVREILPAPERATDGERLAVCFGS